MAQCNGKGACFMRAKYGRYTRKMACACKLSECSNVALCGFRAPEFELCGMGDMCIGCKVLWDGKPLEFTAAPASPCRVCMSPGDGKALFVTHSCLQHTMCVGCVRERLKLDDFTPADPQDFKFRLPSVCLQREERLPFLEQWARLQPLQYGRFVAAQERLYKPAHMRAQAVAFCGCCDGKHPFVSRLSSA